MPPPSPLLFEYVRALTHGYASIAPALGEPLASGDISQTRPLTESIFGNPAANFSYEPAKDSSDSLFHLQEQRSAGTGKQYIQQLVRPFQKPDPSKHRAEHTRWRQICGRCKQPKANLIVVGDGSEASICHSYDNAGT
jgi:hypothetical protein